MKIKVVSTGTLRFHWTTGCQIWLHGSSISAPTSPRAHGPCISPWTMPSTAAGDLEQKSGWHSQDYTLFLPGSGKSLQVRVSTFWGICRTSKLLYFWRESFSCQDCPEQLLSPALISLSIWSLVIFSSWWSSSVWNTTWDAWKNTASRCKESLKLHK